MNNNVSLPSLFETTAILLSILMLLPDCRRQETIKIGAIISTEDPAGPVIEGIEVMEGLSMDRVILLIKDNQKSRIIADPLGSKLLKAACLLGAV